MCQALCRLGPQWCLCTLRLQPCRHAQCQPLTMVSQQEAALLPSVCVSACRLASEQPPGGFFRSRAVCLGPDTVDLGSPLGSRFPE